MNTNSDSNNRHLIVISVDALVTDDLDYVDKYPVFHEMMSKGYVIRNVSTIYPSLTHCVHASIITGRPAGETGITENTVFTPGTADMPWYNNYSEIKCDTVFSIAHKAGLSVAACRWPVTAKAGAEIDYLVPEIMGRDMRGLEDNPIQAYINCGTSDCLLDIVGAALERNGARLSHPVYDESQIDCVCEIIRKYKPNLLFTHPGYVDSERHRTGLFSPFVLKSLDKTAEWIERITDATKDAGIYDSTDFVILSDHGHCPYNRLIMPNVRLVRDGLISLDNDGQLRDWKVYVQSCDLSAHVYLKDSTDTLLREKVEQMLHQWTEDSEMGVESFMTAEEAREKYGLYGGFSYTIEAKEGFAFEDDLVGPLSKDKPPVSTGLGHSAHGHLPYKGPQPVFIGFGPHFEKGRIIENGSVLDHFNIFRRVLDI